MEPVVLPHSKKTFLFLQGPHGPFFAQLASMMLETGAGVGRICFNAGDEHYWPQKMPMKRFLGKPEEWKAFISKYFEKNTVTDLVIYGDTRRIHAEAIELAKARDIKIHCFEEGYLRPYWITYERNGVNGNSALMQMSMDEISQKRKLRHVDLQAAPAQWGNLWRHNWYGFAYHFALARGANAFPNYEAHRGISIWQEVKLNAIRFLSMPWHVAQREWKTRKFLQSGSPFFVVMLQLEHDASLKFHSDYHSQEPFIHDVVEAFARYAPKHYRLIFKLHPLDDARAPLQAWITKSARYFDAEKRVLCIYGGKLGAFMNRAKAAIAINSTSVQQAMWRGIPVKLFGKSVFGKPEFTSSQKISEFFVSPKAPSKEKFLEFRSYLLETSQVNGGYYSSSGRAEVLRSVVDAMLSEQHLYDHNKNFD